MFSFSIAIGPDHEMSCLSRFFVQVPFDAFLSWVLREMKSNRRGQLIVSEGQRGRLAAREETYRIGESDDRRIKQRKRITAAPLAMVVIKVGHGEMTCDGCHGEIGPTRSMTGHAVRKVVVLDPFWVPSVAL